jgi:hypothetical protein
MDDAADELATGLGIDVEFLTAFSRAAEMNGATMQTVADAFKFLGKNMGEAASGNKDVAASFAKLGVSIANGAGGLRPMEEVMLDVGEAIRNMSDGANRIPVAMGLLGKGGTEMITTFMQGRQAIRGVMDDAVRFGAVTTRESARAGGAFQDALGMMRNAWQGIQRTMAVPIMEAVTDQLNGFLDWFRSNPEQIKGIVKDMANQIVVAVKAMAVAIQELIQHMKVAVTLAGTLAGLKTGWQLGSVWGPQGAVI